MTQYTHIPAGYQAVTPYLLVPEARKLLAFLEEVFGASPLRTPLLREDGTMMHTELKIDDSCLMLAESTELWPAFPAMLHVYVRDVDACYNKALVAGATAIQPPSDTKDGDRRGGFSDYAGNQWWVASRADRSKAKTEIRKKHG